VTACLGLGELGDLFHPEQENPKLPDSRQPRAVHDAWAEALTICAGCSTRTACLDAELAMMRAGYVTAGVVGGTTPGQRRALLTHAELSRRPPYELEPCGTLAGYARHHRDGEEPCASCKREHARAAADRKRARRERAGQLVLFPPIDWSVMGPLRRAALAESWRLRNTSGSTASAGLVEPRRFERVPAREARSA